MGAAMTEERMTSILIAAAMVVVIVAMLLVMVSTGHGREVCLTKSQARELWPKKHLYWYSRDHCWSNRRGGPPRGIKVDPVEDPVFPARHTMAKAEEEPECCWPQLDADASGNIAEIPRTFGERWYEFPSVFQLFRQRYIEQPK
jgi:hypothetical protein